VARSSSSLPLSSTMRALTCRFVYNIAFFLLWRGICYDGSTLCLKEEVRSWQNVRRLCPVG
jgi:hypothetical protein